MTEKYESPLSGRYASQQMQHLFSHQHKYGLWRRLWVTLAECQKDLGLSISEKQIKQLREHVDNIDFDQVHEHEKRLKHDVMAHIYAYGDICPEAKGIIHLGATSCYVTDNADLIQMREALDVITVRLRDLIRSLSEQAKKYAALPCLGLTHLQAAQPTTVGKRICLWLQDFTIDLQELIRSKEQIRFLGAKGAVGTQASFLTLFNGDHEKVEALDRKVANSMGFDKRLTISGQTYTRKQDCLIANALGGIAISAHKCASDLRLLASRGEMAEPSSTDQVGSSAMPHKRNPILSERCCALSRFALSLTQNPQYTAATQWMERTLDDSANRRLAIPELFLSTDAILGLLNHIFSNLHVFEDQITHLLEQHLTQLACEQILMISAQKGRDRQELHERLRLHIFEAEPSSIHDFLDRIDADPIFNVSRKELADGLATDTLIGRAPQQVQAFLKEEVLPILGELESKSVESYPVPY